MSASRHAALATSGRRRGFASLTLAARSRPTIPGVRLPSGQPFRAKMNLVSTPAGKRGGLRAVGAHPHTLTPLDARVGPRYWRARLVV